MELSVKRSDFVKELYLVQGIAERRNAIPVLSNVLLEAREGTLELAATDLDLSLKTSVAAQVSAVGSVTINAKKLYEIARALPESDVFVSVAEGDWVSLRCAQSQFKIAGASKEDFPALPSPTKDSELRLMAEAVKDLIGRVSFAMTAEDHRYFLGGVLLAAEGGSVSLVATDGHRLSYARRNGACATSVKKRTLIPRKAIQELSRFMDSDDDVVFGETAQHLWFRVGKRSLTSKTVEGQFPTFETVIATQGDKIVEVETERLVGALRRVSILSSERTKAVKLSLATGRLVFSAVSPDFGEARDEVEVEYGGDEVVVGFNGQYLLEFLGAAGTDHVRIELKNSESQGVFRPVGDKKTEHLYVVMPMRL